MVKIMEFVHNSIKHNDETKPTCDGGSPMEVPADFTDDIKITYTYAVTFVVSLQFMLNLFIDFK